MRDDPFIVNEDDREYLSSSEEEEDEDNSDDEKKIGELDLSQSNLNDLESKFDTNNLNKDDDFVPLEPFPPVEK